MKPMMTSRKRVLTAIDHQEPDRVPIDLGTSDTFMAAEVVQGLAQLLGIDSPAAKAAPHPGAYITPDESILEALGADVRLVGVPSKPRPPSTGGNMGANAKPVRITAMVAIAGVLATNNASSVTIEITEAATRILIPIAVRFFTDAAIKRPTMIERPNSESTLAALLAGSATSLLAYNSFIKRPVQLLMDISSPM